VSKRIDRRQALGALGTISLGGLLAACGKDSGGGPASVATTAGETATVEPRTTTSDATSALFDAAAGCTLTVEETEGPYYFDVDRIRSDIREDRKGTRLRLALRVREASGCKPIPDAVVDIWHADAGGAYSGFDGAPVQTRYLRGAQVTNASGVAEFVTIYPGWYQGRTTHIHAKVHLDNSTVLTTQLFFDDDVSTRVYEGAAYSGRGERDQFNDSDGIFDASLVMTTKRDSDGYLGVMTFDVRSA
jgi:protocatechuate 3,4-dioxygenase beta subunit